MIRVMHGDCREILAGMPADSVDACVTDPPYHLISGNAVYDFSQHRHKRGFMNQEWDGGDVAFRPETWAAVLRVLKPGGHMLCFGGTRTSHRMVCAIEDAGFEIRDTLMFLYGSGFPKSLDVSKAIDKAAGHWRGRCGDITIETQPSKGTEYERTDKGVPITPEAAQWAGWGTALKPAYEPIVLARKPLDGTVAACVLKHGAGAINVDACRVPLQEGDPLADGLTGDYGRMDSGKVDSSWGFKRVDRPAGVGRWPANILHDGSPEVMDAFAAFGSNTSGTDRGERGTGGIWSPSSGMPCGPQYGDSGSPARFFYTSKANAADRADSRHPTVKPIDLMRWLVRLITPPNGTILDPFAGSGTTGEAAMLEGFNAILIEQDPASVVDIQHRIDRWSGADLSLFKSAAE